MTTPRSAMNLGRARRAPALGAAALALVLLGSAGPAAADPVSGAGAPPGPPAADVTSAPGGEPAVAADPAPLAASAAEPAPLPARSITDVPLPPPPLVPAPPPAAGWRLNRFGLALDAGVPDFAGATLLYRPWKYVRLGGALLYDYVGYGVRGGVTILPYFAIAPSLTVEAGHFFETNAAAKLERRGVAIDASIRPVLERFGYTFANAQLGLEIGHPNWFVFYVRAGITRLWYTARGANAVAQAQVDAGSTTRVTIADPSLRAQFPEAKVGLLFFIH